MNEIDLTTKIEGIKKAIAEHEEMSQAHKDSLSKAEKELKDYNKPELTPVQLDDIYEAVEKGVNEFDWNDTENFEIEYGISYDGKVECESHEFRNSDDLVQTVLDEVSKIFTEMKCPEDEPTANEIAQKADEACN